MCGLYFKYLGLVSVILSAVLQSVYGNFLKTQFYETESNDTVLFHKWNLAETRFQEFVESGIKQVMPMVVRANSELDLSTECTSALLTMLRGVRNFEVWAFTMLDAMGKPGDGIMSGSTTSFGAYDQCLNTTVPDGKGGIKFRGQYCSVELRFPLPQKPKHLYKLQEIIRPFDQYKAKTPLFNEFPKYAAYFYNFAYRIGVCVPSHCNVNDIQQIASSITKVIEYNAHVRGCEVLEEGFNMDIYQILLLLVFLLFGVFVFTATIIDYLPEIMNKPTGKSGTKSLRREILEAFSARANTRKLLQTENVGDTAIMALHGIRVLTITWIMLGHSYFFIDPQLAQHSLKALDVVTTIPFQIIANATVAVDTFFYLGGFLFCYLTFTNIEKIGLLLNNLPVLIGHRIWRLLPATMMTVGFTILMPLIGSGPLWKENIGREADVCRKAWWAILIFGNNFRNPYHMCLPHTWFISAYMHLFIFSVLYLYIALRLKKTKLAIFMNIIFILVGVIVPGIVVYIYNLPPIPLAINPDIEQRTSVGFIHIVTYAHTSSYGIGMALGHLLAKYRNQIKFSRVTLLIGWMLAIICNLTIVYSVHMWFNRDFTMVEAIAYASLFRVGWSLGLSWVVAVCAIGQGGLVNHILSCKGFLPISRLTFMAYLIHILVIDGYYSSLRTGFETSNIVIVWYFIAFMMISFGISVICRILIEAPALEVEKAILFRMLVKDMDTEDINLWQGKVEPNKNGLSKIENGFGEDKISKL